MIPPVTVQVLEDADSRDCATILYVREQMGISDSDAAATSRILQLIVASSSLIFAYLDRELQQGRLVASYRVYSGASPRLLLPRTPLAEIKSVQVDGRAIPQTEVLEREIFIQRINPFNLEELPWDGEVVIVDYVGGYRMPSQSPLPSGDVPSPALPPSIHQACNLLVRDFFEQRSRESSVEAEDLGGVISSSFGSQRISPQVTQLLAPFRIIGV